jgi:hypothetical protein
MRSILLMIALGSVWAQAQTRPATPAPAAPAHRTTATVQAPSKRLSDAEIQATIKMKLAKSKIGADKFQFHVQGGVATIEGKTDVVQHKGAATRMAKTSGAIAVVNHIQISEAAKQKAAANLENGRRRAQVKRGDTRSDARSDTSSAATVRSAMRVPATKAAGERKNGGSAQPN